MTAGTDHDHTPGQPGWIDAALAEHERLELDTAGRRQLPLADREQQVLDRIDRARRRRPKVREERITMSHGAGGKATHTLIEAVFLDAFRNPLLEPLEDAARLQVGGATVALTTDSFVVSPVTTLTPAAAAASRMDSVIAVRWATSKPSSRMNPAVRYCGVAPDTARSLTVPLTARSPMLPPGKNNGLTT